MSADDVHRSTPADTGEKDTDTKDSVIDDQTEAVSIPTSRQGYDETIERQGAPSPEGSTVAERQHCSPPTCSSVVKRPRSSSPESSTIHSYTVDDEGNAVKRVRFALARSPPIRAVKVEIQDDLLGEDVLDDVCERETSAATEDSKPVDEVSCISKMEPGVDEQAIEVLDDDDYYEDMLDTMLAPRTATQPSTDSGSEHLADVAGDWLLDPNIACRSGMLVIVRGSLPNESSSGWHNGAYEDAQAVVLSVFNTGRGNTTFMSTARVRFLKPLNPVVDTFAVPVEFLWPVKPDDVDQEALIIGGEYTGYRAKLREEVEATNLCRLLPLDD